MANALGTSSDALQLPSGGGALSGLGESFTPDLQTGSGNFSVPIVCPEAQNGLRPDLTLGYTTGGGNGPFGMGFRIPTMAIQRETARGVPSYDDSTDRFLFTDGGRLIDCGDGRFRPEVDTANWLIRRDGDGWVVVTKDGTRYRLGQSANARVEADGRVATWLLQTTTDPNGQEILYRYREEGPQRYLERVTYGPFDVRVEYGRRPDVITSRRTGFVVKTALRAEQIRVLSQRDGTHELRRYELSYIAPEPRRLSLLHRIQLVAGSGDTRAAMPPVTLDYTPLDLAPGALEVFSTTGDITPPPLSEGNASLVDLAGDGLQDVISTDAFGTIYWRNLGAGRFAAPERIRPLPGLLGLGDEAVQFIDVEGNGTADLLVGGTAAGYLPNAAALDWEPFVQYALTLPFDLNDPNLRLTDIDGDGREPLGIDVRAPGLSEGRAA